MTKYVHFASLIISFVSVSGSAETDPSPAVGNLINTLTGLSKRAHCLNQSLAKVDDSCAMASQFPYQGPDPTLIDKTLLSLPVSPICKKEWSQEPGFTKAYFNRCGTHWDRYIPMGADSQLQNYQKNIASKESAKALKDSMLKKVQRIKSQVAESCCGTDAKCLEAMKRVPVHFCEDDPAAAKLCPSGTQFVFYDSDSFGLANELLKKFKTATSNNPIEKIMSEEVTKAFGGPSFQLKALMSSNPLSPGFFNSLKTGGVLLGSPMKSDTTEVGSQEWRIKTDHQLYHELHHVCSFVSQQLGLSRAARASDEQYEYLHVLTQYLSSPEGYCGSFEKAKSIYQKLWLQAGESSDLAKCLETIADRASDPQNSQTFCKNICKTRYLEESYALASEFQSLNSENQDSLINELACYGVQDGQHPPISEIVTCLQQHSPRFRDQISKVLKCEPLK